MRKRSNLRIKTGRYIARHQLPIILTVALLPEIILLSLSYLWTLSNIEHDMAFLASGTARRANNIFKVTKANLKQLAEHTSAHCDDAAVDFMHDKVFNVMYIRETGIINDNKLMCTNVKLFDPPVDITDAEHRRIADRDGDIVIVPPVPTLQGGKSILVNYRVSANSYVNALIDPDIFHEFHDYVRLGEVSGVFLVREDGEAIFSFGSMSEDDLPPIIANAESIRHYHSNSFSVYKSGDFPIYAVVAASQTFILQHWLRDALVVATLGGLMSLAIVLVLKKKDRRLNLLQDELWQAIEKNELCVYYQPMMDMGRMRCVGAEALIRWQHPERGLILPLVFIPISEQTGMIRQITRWLIERVELELGDTLNRNPEFHVSINLSPSDLGAIGDKAVLDDLLFNHVPQKQVIYEITEHTQIPDNAVSAYGMMASLRSHGAKLALDDFGTGYSNINYLNRFPVDYLKIDKVFVDTIRDDVTDSHLIDHIISIAKTLNLDVIAEGIELESQATYLKDRGVNYGQGWYFAKAMPVDELIKVLEQK